MDKPHNLYVDYKKPDIKAYAMMIPFTWCLRTCKANPRWQKSEGWFPMGCVSIWEISEDKGMFYLLTREWAAQAHALKKKKKTFKCPLTNIHWTLCKFHLSRYMNLITSPFFPQSGVSMRLVTLLVSEKIKGDTNNTAFLFENCFFFTCFNIIRFPFWWEYDYHINAYFINTDYYLCTV